MATTPVRFGVLGAARIAPAALVRPARTNPEVTLEAVAARDPARGQAFARRHQVRRVLETYEAVVSDPEVDAVYVPLPNSLHAEWTLAALEAGKHVLCEKPFTSNAGQARAVAAAAPGSGLVVMEAFHYRHHPLAHRMHEIVDRGELGRLRHIETWLCAPILNKSDIRYQYGLSGGAMMDMGSYVVHMARMLGGEEPTVVSAQAKLQSPDVDRAMSACLQFPAGHTASVHCSMWSSSVLHLAARVVGEQGEMRVFNPISPQYASWLRVRSSGTRRTEIPSRRPTYSFQLDAFCEAVLRDGPVLTGREDAVANMEVIDAVYRAANMAPRAT
ncbi:MAG TPA: Gfo/Idh/MocA family oxidoreductase [Acidimicrobiales bacterium]|jgi:predicted dehydrogenase|nr:Gfo/Idh/MocA family oxidoreductase [Acidimicrobiales bacterium]